MLLDDQDIPASDGNCKRALGRRSKHNLSVSDGNCKRRLAVEAKIISGVDCLLQLSAAAWSRLLAHRLMHAERAMRVGCVE